MECQKQQKPDCGIETSTNFTPRMETYRQKQQKPDCGIETWPRWWPHSASPGQKQQKPDCGIETGAFARPARIMARSEATEARLRD